MDIVIIIIVIPCTQYILVYKYMYRVYVWLREYLYLLFLLEVIVVACLYSV